MSGAMIWVPGGLAGFALLAYILPQRLLPTVVKLAMGKRIITPHSRLTIESTRSPIPQELPRGWRPLGNLRYERDAAWQTPPQYSLKLKKPR